MWSSKAYVLIAAGSLLASSAVLAAEDLRALEVLGQRDQSVEQTRRDRYECHHWAVAQTGETPMAVGSAEEERHATRRNTRRERIDRAIAGAAIGAGVGGVLGGGRHHDVGERVLVGAAAGAAIGAATARRDRREVEAAEEPSDYLRALSACLEGRGYSVRMPTAADFTASRR
jgi:outer membrane lipoprotein SlyB